MKHSICTEIVINAPIETVWDALVRFDRYASWNPFIVYASGEAVVGSMLDIKIKRLGKKEQPYKVKILELEPLKRFRWLGHFVVPGLCDGDHYFEPQVLSPTQTLLVHREDFSGLFVPWVLKNFDLNFIALNEALKRYVEAGSD